MITSRFCFSALLVVGACTSATPKHDTARASTEQLLPAGEFRFAVDGGRVWYKISGGGTGIPLILLHGGPGVSSFYLKPFEDLGNDRRVVRYDQLGSGKSDSLTDTTKFTIAHFVEELEALRAHLGYDYIDLPGHSWGTTLAVEYYRAHPNRVASMTLESPFLDAHAWDRNTRTHVRTLSDSAQRAIRRREADHQYQSPDYQAANDEYFKRYVTRHPVAADGESTQARMNEKLYEYMEGPSEFTFTGTLKDYDATPLLRTVKIPTLYTVGEFDEADPTTVRRLAALTPGPRVVEFRGAAHLTPWDARDENLRVVRAFLRSVDPVTK